MSNPFNKRKMIITVGVSASGKTTWANQQEGFEIICRDTIRGVLFPEYHNGNYKFTKAKENHVSEVTLNQWLIAVEHGSDVIIADTNLNPKYREMWKQRGEDADYVVEFKDFPITLEEAWKHDQKRGTYSVGREVISRQWKLWLEYSSKNKYVADTSKPQAILVDIDGTIADKGSRNPFDWGKVGEDKPRDFIIDLIYSYLERCKENDNYIDVIFLSGRDSCCRYEALEWLQNQFATPKYNINLFMRKEGDMRKDTVVKEEFFWVNVANNYNVLAVFDDRPCVVEMWYDIGIPNVICVADQRNRF